ncbi:hypothetical protein WUBG_14733, partial [Wuchereria bancrofti]
VLAVRYGEKYHTKLTGLLEGKNCFKSGFKKLYYNLKIVSGWVAIAEWMDQQENEVTTAKY